MLRQLTWGRQYRSNHWIAFETSYCLNLAMKSLLLPVVEEQSRRHDRKPLRAVYVLITQISEGWVRGHGGGEQRSCSLPSMYLSRLSD